MDNYEHAADASADLLAGPGLRVMAASYGPLRLARRGDHEIELVASSLESDEPAAAGRG